MNPLPYSLWYTYIDGDIVEYGNREGVEIKGKGKAIPLQPLRVPGI
jgi:hypothetical protein